MAMKWEKPSEALTKAFDSALPDDALVERKKMFGMPAAFVNGNMFAGVHQTDIVVRLPEAKRAEIAQAGASQFEPMAGRPMREYMVVPASMHADTAALSAWVGEAFRFGMSLPVKEAKPRKARKASA
jgi:TfoX/Sxy family transcriptional regulator of competence genes